MSLESTFTLNEAIKTEPVQLVLIKEENSLQDLSAFSYHSSYSDSVWYLDKYFPHINFPAKKRRFVFEKLPADMQSFVKAHMYRMLLRQASLEVLHNTIVFLGYFFDYCEISKYQEITKHNISKYYFYLTQQNITQKTKYERWKAVKDFLNFIKWEYSAELVYFDMPYPKNMVPNNEKYIDEYILNQLDVIMKSDEDVPLAYRLLYWLLRLFPGRATEVCSYPLDCVKYCGDNKYIITSKVNKTAGGQSGTPKLLMIDIDDPVQNYLYMLIRQQQEVAREILENNPDLQSFLFWSHRSRYLKRLGRYMFDKKPMLVNVDVFNNFLREFLKRKEVVDRSGNTAKISSHMFRHNATTDRVDCKIFRPIDLRPMTLHANEQMFNKAYHNRDPQTFVEDMHKVESVKKDQPVVFNGKIINSENPAAYSFFLKNPFAYQIGHLGICTDSRGCSGDKMACLGCDYFIPNANDRPYFEEQITEWEKKRDIAKKMKQQQYLENVEHNLSLIRKVLQKIDAALKEDEQWSEVKE